MERQFGRLISQDQRDLKFALPRMQTQRRYRHWTLNTVLDQGTTSQCVGYSGAGYLMAGPVVNKNVNAADLYKMAQANDEWPGDDYEGSSVRGLFKGLKERGYVGSYVWAFDAAVLEAHVLETGPFVFGTWWKSGMMAVDRHGFIHASGQNHGGHAYLVIGANRTKKCPDGSLGAFRIQNSWGRAWGEAGRAWLSFADAQALLADSGEACTSLELKIVSSR